MSKKLVIKLLGAVRNSIIPALSCAAIRGKTIHVTDPSTWVSMPNPFSLGEGCYTLEALKLADKGISAQPAYPLDDFPEIPAHEIVNRDSLRPYPGDAVRSVCHAVSRDSSRMSLLTPYLQDGMVVGTDGHRLAAVIVDGMEDRMRLGDGGELFRKILPDLNGTMHVEKHNTSERTFVFRDGLVVSWPEPRLGYPNPKRVISDSPDHVELEGRHVIMMRDFTKAMGKERTLCKFSPVTGFTVFCGETRAGLDIELGLIKYDSIFDARFMLDAIDFAGKIFRLGGAGNPASWNAGNKRCMLMPCKE